MLSLDQPLAGMVKDMMFTWFFTFPACGLISFVMAKLFMMFL